MSPGHTADDNDRRYRSAAHTNARVGRRGRIGSGRGEGQTFWAVRRQRLQALTFATLPSRVTVIGWRLGSHRRSARLRFIPTDWGFQPVIGRLPQMSQTRAMVERVSNHMKNPALTAPERRRW
jgi:hypothetical protein